MINPTTATKAGRTATSRSSRSRSTGVTRDADLSSRAGDVLKRNSRSFSIAASFLPGRVRGNVQQLYAWCRCVDDAVDHASTSQDAESELDRLTADLSRITDEGFSGIDQLQHPASHWIAPLILEHGVEVAHAHDLIEGMRMDLRLDSGELSIDTDSDVLRYSYHAAGTVALMMTQLMGVTTSAPRSAARSAAVSLGVAMQLTNIARDVREDAERGRCYLPRVGDVSQQNQSAVIDSVRHLLKVAEDRYRIAESGLRYLPRDCRRSIRVALVAYREIGREILRRDCDVLAGRVVVPKLRLLWVVAHASLQGFLPMMTSPENTTATGSVAGGHSASSVDQCKSAVWLGLSLTAFMGTALFMMVYANPKSDAYSTLPLVYAAVSFAFAIVANRLSARYENEHRVVSDS